MIGISKLYCGTVEPSDALRYGRHSGKMPSHLLQFSEDKKPVVVWNGDLSIASYEDGEWFVQDEDGYVYERVGCGSGCCWTEQKKKLFYAPSHWMEPDILIRVWNYRF